MAKLALFIPDLSGGGAERCFVNLARGLVERGHSVDLLVSHKFGPYLAEIPASVRIIDLKVRLPILSFGRVAAYLKAERPKMLYSALNQANVAAIIGSKLSRTKTPVAIGVHNSLSREAKDGSSLNLKAMPYFVKLFYPMADEIVVVSEGVGDDLAKLAGIARDRMTVIYNPVVTDALFAKASRQLDHPWFAPGEPPVILSVGRLNVQKDYGTLIRAFKKVVDKSSARLIILGEGDERIRLTTIVKELGLEDLVSLFGFTDNPYAYMRQARLFVLSSLYEGLPTVIIESLAAGCPVVSTDCPSGPREILGHGKLGALVPVGDVDGLSCAILSALASPKVTVKPTAWEPYLLQSATRKYEGLATKQPPNETPTLSTKGQALN